jgi:DNA-directed RNA polymerase specialized sigma24 family protein
VGNIVNIREQTPERIREIFERVLLVARRLSGSASAADDLTQQAFLLLETTRRWDPTQCATVERHLCGIVMSLLSAERGSARPRIEAQAGLELAARSEAGRSAETMALERADREDEQAFATRRVAALRAKLAGQQLELSICDLLAEETEQTLKAAQMASRLGRPVGEVYEALSRIRRYMDTIVAIERDEGHEV